MPPIGVQKRSFFRKDEDHFREIGRFSLTESALRKSKKFKISEQLLIKYEQLKFRCRRRFLLEIQGVSKSYPQFETRFSKGAKCGQNPFPEKRID